MEIIYWSSENTVFERKIDTQYAHRVFNTVTDIERKDTDTERKPMLCLKGRNTDIESNLYVLEKKNYCV